MPYLLEGNCVYKKNPDGSKGKSMGCSDTPSEAKKHLAALYAAEKSAYSEFSMAIVKVSIPDKLNRTMRISMVNSDTSEDVFEERMSTELFNDFVERIESNAPVPSPFDIICEDGWNGGMPYPSISHYKSGAGRNVPGEIERVYVDGERLKSSAILHETPLGLAVWKSICTDEKESKKPLEERSFANPVRISIGFLDLEHKHEIDGENDFVFTRTELGQKCQMCEDGIKGKVYLKGQLVHLAFTRVPANPRTSVEVLKMGDEITTKLDDAKAIIGDLADELVGKSAVEDEVLVVKAEKKDRDQGEEDEDEKDADMEKSEVTDEVVEETAETEPEVVEESVSEPEPEKSRVDVAVESFKSKIQELQTKNVRGDDAAKVLQPFMDEIAQATREVIDPKTPQQEMAETMRSVLRDELNAMKPELVAEVLKALPTVSQQVHNEVPKARSLFLPKGNPEQVEKTTLRRLAEKGLVE